MSNGNESAAARFFFNVCWKKVDRAAVVAGRVGGFSPLLTDSERGGVRVETERAQKQGKAMAQLDENFTEKELRTAFKLCGLWRLGWTYDRAIHTYNIALGLRNIVRAIRRKYQQNGNPAPQQRALI